VLWIFVVFAVWAIIYWKKSQGELESARNRLLSEQRAVGAELGPRFFPLRDQIEAWTVDGSSKFAGDLVDSSAAQSKFRSKPGVYLRLLVDDGKDPTSIRKAAVNSLRDGFTSCLMQANNPDPWGGKECKHNAECEPGQHCNETKHCSVPAQPYNLRTAYRATRILEESWIKEVRDAGDDKRLLVLQRDFQDAVKEDVPLVIDLMARAQFFILVLDEKTEVAPEIADGGTLSEALQTIEHPVRVFIYDLAQRKPILRIRRSVAAQVGLTTADPQTIAAVRRQANNCAVALEVRKALGDDVSP